MERTTPYYGDYAFGNEVLRLPAMDDDLPGGFPAIGTLCLPRLGSQFDTRFDQMSTYWFRWITGHQVMLLLWQVLNRDLRAKHSFDQAILMHYTQVWNLCTLIYEYTGSCTLDYYGNHIRPVMMRVHQGFTGRWASDYVGLPKAVNRAARQGECNAAAQRMRDAYLQSQKAHLAIADRLVPEGASLLKSAKADGIEAVAKVCAHHQAIFDHFFLISRGAVSATELFESLQRRLAAIDADLRANPLDGSALSGSPELTLRVGADAIARLLEGWCDDDRRSRRQAASG
ncbi:MAG: hypothetical protein N838_30010 [Thiohalocapsa sp. PB-PSB1]|jgi:hypothetical protein|nr:MAG: hypothetical protein N838_15285 [Thiohalocapsa sp. PB-PSB1]QQO56957.1 MAG: hypothetical protein N838_30010 [Thiohalocapsa sp. PB-PSB1]HCS89811.1 hypothetical protein [Chromatiaceae bacterium]